MTDKEAIITKNEIKRLKEKLFIKEQECEEKEQSENEAKEIIAELKAECEELQKENKKYKEEIMLLRKGYDEEDCTETCPNIQVYQKELDQLKAENEKLKQECNILKQALKNKNIVAIVEENEKLKEKLKTFVIDDKWVHPEVLALKNHQFCAGMGKDCIDGTVECQQKECSVRDYPKFKQALNDVAELINRLKGRTPIFEMEEIARDIIEIENIINKAKRRSKMFKFKAILKTNDYNIEVTPYYIMEGHYVIDLFRAQTGFKKKYPEADFWGFVAGITKQDYIQEVNEDRGLIISKDFTNLVQDKNFNIPICKDVEVYRQALEDIESICNNISSNGLDEEVDKFDDILDIVNKVKE